MHGFEFLDEMVMLCVAALVVILVFQRFRMPPIIGLIVAGLLLGPSGIGLVHQDEIISAISELGVVMLLFTIGLEFSLDDLRRLRGIVFIGGPLQVGLSTAVIGGSVALAAAWAGTAISTNGAIMIGMAMALSSTAICTKLLTDRRELRMPHGRAVLGILIFQDIAVVPMMIIVTMLGIESTSTMADLLLRVVTLIGVSVALVAGMRLLLPRLVPYVTRVAVPEVLILGGLALCLGAAWITSLAGMSMALGAFIAGMAIAGSEEGHAIGKAIQPMRDAFTSMFFLSVGLLVNISWAWLPLNIASALLVLVMNAIVAIVVFSAIRVPMRTAVMAGVILAQVGEFSFVLGTLGVEYGVITSVDFQHMLVAIISTMIVTPTLITLAPHIANRVTPLARYLPRLTRWESVESTGRIRIDEMQNDSHAGPTVIIIGAGVLGQSVARVLRDTNIPYVIVELNHETVSELRASGEPIVPGDITDGQTLEHVGIRTASIVIVAINDREAILQGLTLIRSLRPDVDIVVRARYLRNASAIVKRGADAVIVEEVEASVKVFAAVLRRLGVDEDQIASQEVLLRSHVATDE